MAETRRDLTDGEGRSIRVYEAGDPEGHPVFFLHGTPMSGTFYRAHVEDALDRDLRLVSYDRPGYGGSRARPGRPVVDAAEDVRYVADTLGLDRFALWGVSGGGPHALACAARLSDRVVAAAAVGSLAPYGAAGLDFFAGMGESNLREFEATRRGPEVLRRFLEAERSSLSAEGDEPPESLATLLSEVDLVSFRAGVGAFLAQSAAVGLAPGVDGWADDDLAFLRPWGFELGSIHAPLLVVHGMQDRFVPFAHGVWISEHVPGSSTLFSAADGHLSLFERRIPDVHAWLARHFGPGS